MDFTNHLANFTRKSIKIINKFNQFRSFKIIIIIVIIIIVINDTSSIPSVFTSLLHACNRWNPFTCNGCYSEMAVAVMAVLRR